jgi:hypothetical protein
LSLLIKTAHTFKQVTLQNKIMLQKILQHKERKGFQGPQRLRHIHEETTKSEQKFRIAICFSESYQQTQPENSSALLAKPRICNHVTEIDPRIWSIIETTQWSCYIL